LVKNTKAKIRRASKNYGIDLSNEIELPSLESFSSRKEFNEWKNKQSSFTNRANTHYQFNKNQYGVVASKHFLQEIERNVKKAQKIADEFTKKAKEKEFRSGGKVQGTLGQRMLQMARPTVAGISRPPDFDFSKIRSNRDLMRKAEAMENRSNIEHFDKRMIKMRESYIETLKATFNSDANDLIEKFSLCLLMIFMNCI